MTRDHQGQIPSHAGQEDLKRTVEQAFAECNKNRPAMLLHVVHGKNKCAIWRDKTES